MIKGSGKRLGLLAMGLCLLLASLVAGCDDRDLVPEHGVIGQSRQPITYGEVPPTDDAKYDAVVSLHKLDRRGAIYVYPFCTGTLIAGNVILTAAHCLDTAKGSSLDFKTVSPSSVVVYFGDNAPAEYAAGTLTAADFHDIVDTRIHPDYDRVRLLNDIGLMRTADVSAVPPVPVLPAGLGLTEADVGVTLNFAGFGEDETGAWGVRLQADGSLAGLGCALAVCPGPGDPATQISYAQRLDPQNPIPGPCFGDSGGPAFVQRLDTWYVAGVTSYGDADCGAYGVSTRADAYEAWIAAFTAQPPAPDCSADGSCNPDCAGGEDPDCSVLPGSCGNGICGAGESCDGRNGTASCPSDCPGLLTGKPAVRYCYVEGACTGAGCR